MWRRALDDLRGVWLLQSLLRMRGESGRRGWLMQLSKTEPSLRNRLTRSYSPPLSQRPGGSTVSPFTSIDARTLINGSAAHHIAKMSAPIPRSRVRTTAGVLPFSKASSLGEEVNANAAVHLQHRDDRKPTGPQPVGRVAI